MKNFFTVTLVSSLLSGGMNCATAAWPSESSSVVLKGSETPEQIQETYNKAITTLASALGYGKESNKALQKFEATVHHAARPGAEAERLALGNAVAAALQSEVPAEAKAWMLKLMAFVGRAELIPTEAKLLEAENGLVRESARCALQHNPVPEAAAALRSALEKATEPSWQAALALALGTRKDAASVPLIARLLAQKEEVVVEAALYALGNIANAEAARILARIRQTVPDKLRVAAAESYMKCAEQMIKEGRTTDAAGIYRELYQPLQPRPVRLAALEGILKTSGDEAATKILDMLAADDADARGVAAGFIPDLSSGGLKILAGGLGKLPTAMQSTLLGTLAERGEKSALPVALNFAKSNDETMRLAGLTALGRLGDTTTVVFLTETMQSGGSAAGIARDSLTRLNATGVNEAIITAVQREVNPGQRSMLIEVLEIRGASAAVTFLIQEVAGDTAGTRRAAMRALGKLAQPGDVPGMLKGLLKTAPGSERDESERSIALVCARAPHAGKQAEVVLELYRGASPADRLVLLPLLGRLGGAKSLEVVKTALASSDEATYQVGVAAISNWPEADADIEEQLLTLAQKAEKPNDRAVAARAYVRVISQSSGLPDPERLKKFERAMALAERDSERNFILERVMEIHRIETVRFAVRYLDQPALAQRAGTTIVELAKDRGLRDRNKAEFEQALNKILEASKDQNLNERVKRRLQEK